MDDDEDEAVSADEPGIGHEGAAEAGGPEMERVRESLSRARGRRFWRSLEELAATPEFEEMLHREFPRQASEWPEGLDRRRFLQLTAASLGLAGLTACTRQPLERIVPYVKQPEDLIPGRPLFYATTMTLGGYARGLLVESHEGRPTKIEGNPLHPASLGGTDAFAQAAVLGLYDPDRSQVLTELGEIQTWAAFVRMLSARLKAQAALKGEGLRILTETVTSPTLAEQIRGILARFPGARWHQYEPLSHWPARDAQIRALGQCVEVRYDFTRADVVVALDADFAVSGPAALRYARDFASRRRARTSEASAPAMSRFYAAQSVPTLTATLADHHVALAASLLPRLAFGLAARIGVEGVGAAVPAWDLEPAHDRWIRAAAADAVAHAGRSLIVPGEFAPAEVHVLAHAMNARLGNVGTTLTYADPVEAEPVDQIASLRELTRDLNAGRVDLLLVLGGNPVFTAPADLGFTQAFQKASQRVHLSSERNETTEYSQWHVPEAHFLEAWGDARAYDGTLSLVQPLIEPLYGGKSALEVLSVFDQAPRSGYEIVRAAWQSRLGAVGSDHGAAGFAQGAASFDHGAASFEKTWRRTLHDGLLAGSASAAKTLAVRANAVSDAARVAIARPGRDGALELNFRPDTSVYDGRFANNGWLQELPRPASKITWDNAAYLSPASARELGVETQDVIAIEAGGHTVELPVWVLPGHPDRTVSVHLGYGRRQCGSVGRGVGVDVYPLRTSGAPWLLSGAAVRKTDARAVLASTQEHFSMEGRGLVRLGTLDELKANPELIHEQGERPPRDLNFFSGFTYEGHAWGLAVDLAACTGCSACVIACQAENNIPIVGKEQVARGREMHWLRIDRYYEGVPEAPDTHHQPVLCMHCEQAPCELVCPVAATSHSSEGLNDMVYNRCVGTRYCSNNCPYKVRRFNFLKYNHDDTTPVLKLLHNPNVTVRSRGVMEKCSYCVQRINAARIDSEREQRPLRDGEIVTACQQACPTQAIVFGDINDPASAVSRLKAEPTNYGLLEELNTRPRTSYLAKIRNPRADLEERS